MARIYIDSDFKCHVADGGTLRPIDTDFFDGKCDIYIEGYRYIPAGEKWMREDGAFFEGEMILAWKEYRELDAAQRQYEREQIADMKAALELIGVRVDE